MPVVSVKIQYRALTVQIYKEYPYHESSLVYRQKRPVEILKDRTSFILLLIVPLVLIITVGAAFGGLFNSGSSQIDVTVALSNHDTGYVGKTMLSALNINNSQLKITVKQYSDPAQVKQVVGNSSNNVSAGVVIPAGTTDKLIAASSNGGSTQNLSSFIHCPAATIPVSPSHRAL